MATLRQKKLATSIVENIHAAKPLNAGQMLENVGYAKSVAEAKPGEIISSKGVTDELHKLGFDEESAKYVVASILIDPLQDAAVRISAAKEVFKVHGTYAAEKTFNLTANASVDELKDIIQKDLAKFRPNN